MSGIKVIILSCARSENGWQEKYELLIGGGKKLSFTMEVYLRERDKFGLKRHVEGVLCDEDIEKIGVSPCSSSIHMMILTQVTVAHDQTGVTLHMDGRAIEKLQETS